MLSDYTWFLHALVLSFVIAYIYIRVYLLLAWYPRDVLVGPFLLAEVRLSVGRAVVPIHEEG